MAIDNSWSLERLDGGIRGHQTKLAEAHYVCDRGFGFVELF